MIFLTVIHDVSTNDINRWHHRKSVSYLPFLISKYEFLLDFSKDFFCVCECECVCVCEWVINLKFGTFSPSLSRLLSVLNGPLRPYRSHLIPVWDISTHSGFSVEISMFWWQSSHEETKSGRKHELWVNWLTLTPNQTWITGNLSRVKNRSLIPPIPTGNSNLNRFYLYFPPPLLLDEATMNWLIAVKCWLIHKNRPFFQKARKWISIVRIISPLIDWIKRTKIWWIHSLEFSISSSCIKTMNT